MELLFNVLDILVVSARSCGIIGMGALITIPFLLGMSAGIFLVTLDLRRIARR